MAKTPPPWTVYDDTDPLKIGIKGFTRSIGSVHVATVIMPENAELIINAVNNHDALVEAVGMAVEYLEPEDSFRPAVRLREKLLAILDAVGVPNPD